VTEWLTPRQVADRTVRDVSEVRRSLEIGELHGHQKSKGGHWRIDAACVDPWVANLESRSACCCRNLRLAGRRAS
jgi:hypothetical protein